MAACSDPPAKPAAEHAPGPTPTVQRTSIGELPDVDVDAVLAHTKVLSSDQYEGRGPGTKGEELTVALPGRSVQEDRRASPATPTAPTSRRCRSSASRPTPAPLVFRKDSTEQQLKWKDDVVAWTKHVADSAAIENSELVFVGYGVVAPEFNWDDYKGLDVKGKTLVMLVNDPPVPDPAERRRARSRRRSAARR